MTYQQIKLVNKEVIKVEVSIEFTSNGWDEFNIDMCYYDREKRPYEEKITFKGKTYRMCGFGVNETLLKEHFPDFIPFLSVRGKDMFGMSTLCVQNMLFYLNSQEHFGYACEKLLLTEEQGHYVKKFSEKYFIEFLKEHIKKVTRPNTEEKIKLLESLTKQKYEHKDFLSPELYNEIIYIKSNKKYRNTYKNVINKNTLEYPEL